MTLQDLQLDNQLYRVSQTVTVDTTNSDLAVASVSTNPLSAVVQSTETASTSIASGELIGNIFVSNGFLRSKNFVTGVSGWTINADGSVEFDSGYFRGDITGATGTFSGTVSVGSLNIPDSTTVSSMHVDTNGNAWWGTNVATGYATAPAKILATGAATFTSATITGALTAGAGSSLPTTYLSGTVGLSNTNIAAQGWTNTCVFSATDYRVVAWATGVITTAAGTAYNITGANTGNMAAVTYIYLDIAVSTTLLQVTTTAATAVGSGKILVAVATPNTDTASKAQYQVFGGIGGIRVFVDNISANSASINEFVSNTAQIANLVVTDAKIGSLAVSKLTAGTITSKAITLAVSAGTGDVKIQAGKTDFGDTTNGFILGIDDSDSDLAKFEIGNDVDFFTWNGVKTTMSQGAVVDFFTDKIVKVGNANDLTYTDNSTAGSSSFTKTYWSNFLNSNNNNGGGDVYSDSIIDGSKNFALGVVAKFGVSGNQGCARFGLFNSVVGSIGIGITDDQVSIAYDLSDSKLYFTTASSATQEVTEITGITATNYNYYKIIKTSTAVKCFVNGILKATHTTRIPTDTTMNWLFSSYTGASSDNISITFYDNFTMTQAI